MAGDAPTLVDCWETEECRPSQERKKFLLMRFLLNPSESFSEGAMLALNTSEQQLDPEDSLGLGLSMKSTGGWWLMHRLIYSNINLNSIA